MLTSATKETLERAGRIQEAIAMKLAFKQARRDIPIIGWYDATENAALDHGVSLPELQRLLSK